MKTALLVCDHVLPDLVPEHGDYPMMFARLLPDLNMDSWYVCDGHFPDIRDYDVFVITGSKYSVYDDIPWIQDLKVFVRVFNPLAKNALASVLDISLSPRRWVVGWQKPKQVISSECTPFTCCNMPLDSA